MAEDDQGTFVGFRLEVCNNRGNGVHRYEFRSRDVCKLVLFRLTDVDQEETLPRVKASLHLARSDFDGRAIAHAS
jgi:hypothetical protein